MKMRVALFRRINDFGIDWVSAFDWPANQEKEPEVSGYIRLTEWVEVEFPDLQNVNIAQAQVEAIDKQIKAVREKLTDEVMRLERHKAELLALPAPEVA